MTEPATGFDDLLAANREFASRFDLAGLPGAAGAGVLVLTCMDSRIDPLRILGLHVGDVKVLRNAGARLTDAALEGMVLGTNLLGVERILVIGHTKCAVASNTKEQIEERVAASSGQEVSEMSSYDFHVVTDQVGDLTAAVATLRDHPLVPDTTAIGGFVYDVDTGLVEQVA